MRHADDSDEKNSEIEKKEIKIDSTVNYLLVKRGMLNYWNNIHSYNVRNVQRETHARHNTRERDSQKKTKLSRRYYIVYQTYRLGYLKRHVYSFQTMYY